jgi:hypothetical protein
MLRMIVSILTENLISWEKILKTKYLMTRGIQKLGHITGAVKNRQDRL